jgi:acyl-coenzyme A synthetase/AMP-(fatty) acid ligase
VLECESSAFDSVRQSGQEVHRQERPHRQESIKFCHGQLTNYKVPKQMSSGRDLPKTNIWQILRRELRDEKAAA